MRLSTRDSRVPRANRSLRTCWMCVLAIVCAGAACGKKGPPLAPFSRVPAAVAGITPQRIGNDVYLSFAVPSTNADNRKPADIGEIRVYAVTSDRVPQTEKQRELATLIATVPVRPIMPEPPPPPPGNVSAPPPVPLPPGVDRGANAIVRESLSAEMEVPVELPLDKKAAAQEPKTIALAEGEVPVGPLVAPPPTRLPRRHYFAIAVSTRDRNAAPSPVASMPLETGASAPGAPTIASDATTLTITWPPPPDARTSTFLLPPTPKPAATPANATPANVTPTAPVPAPLPILTAKSLGFNSEATRYAVYDVSPTPPPTAAAATTPSPAPVETVADNPYAIKQPAPLPPGPISDTEFVIKGVTFGVERCFEVRPVDTIYGATVIGPASPRVCITPQDVFPPAAPKSLAAIAAPGVINLIWDANTETDLAGYLVLRGEAPGDTLQAITAAPITTNTFRDETVRPGTRYVYAVVAVDRATPQNVSAQSNRVEETARQ